MITGAAMEHDWEPEGLWELLVQGTDIVTLVLGTITLAAGEKDGCDGEGLKVGRLGKRLF